MDGPHIEGNEAWRSKHSTNSQASVAAIGLATPWEKLLQTRQGLQPTKTCYENKQMAASLGLWQYTTVSLNVSKYIRISI